jgi:hypothetical protein
MAGAFALLLLGSIAAADKAPERKVHGTTITSKHDPAVKIRLPKAAHYIGGDRWDLYGVADAEIHVFVEATGKRIQRMYWVQFEAYLPDNTHSYDYPFTEKLTHGGREFDVSANFGLTNNTPRAGSDGERMRALVKQAGFEIPPERMSVRLVHLVDDAKRKELMIIYAEDLAMSGTTVEELGKPENKAKWEGLKAALIERAKERIKLTF